MASLTLVFMGTPSFALPTFHALLSAGHRIAAVYTQPPRPAGRGQRERISPVHAAALERGIPVRTPRSLKDPDEQASFAALGADAAVVVAYGLILPKPILEAPRLGCLNLHASLLPRWRGAAPIQRAIMAGDPESGVTVMQMDAGLDAGPMLLQLRVPIAPGMTAGELHDLLAERGAPLMVEALAGLAAGTLQGRPQPTAGVTYAAKIDKDETVIDWRLSAAELDRRIRGLSPSPGAWFGLGSTRIKVLRAAPLPDEHGAPPGQVLDDRLAVACGDGALRLLELQRAGKGPMDAGAFLRGFPVPAGSRLG